MITPRCRRTILTHPRTTWGKNPMTRTQWRRYQRKKKAEAQASTSSTNANFPPLTKAHVGKRITFPPLTKAQVEKRRIAERLFPPLPPIIEGNEKIPESNEDDTMLTDNFDSGSEEDLNIICNVVSIMPAEFDRVSEVTEDEYDSVTKESKDHKPICYYVMNEGEVIETDDVCKRPTETMKSHLKPLYIWAKVEDVGINKVLIDGGAAINLMPSTLLKEIGKSISDLRPHNMVLSDFEGKTTKSLGVILLSVRVGTVIRPTLFVVVASKANYNMLLGREWIHGVGAVPSTLHQVVSIWRDDGVVENIEADQSYFLAEVAQINRANFETRMAHIAPYSALGNEFSHPGNTTYAIRLDPIIGFT